MSAELGIIEGFYGEPWSWSAREHAIAFLKPHGYRFYYYAPKADAYLRKRWREPHPAEIRDGLAKLSQFCRTEGVRFGVGLSPYELYRNFDGTAKGDLDRKLGELDQIGVDSLAILFDDMRGDLPDLARTQIEIMHWIAPRTKAKHLMMCPSYYTDDPMLDRVFGQRPEDYLEHLGRGLDRAIDIFWTGEEVCSREYSVSHLARVAGQLGRKPFLWDNYPVNDGPRMSQYLHLRAFTGRPKAIGDHLAGHAVNPACQPVLSLIPALTLADSYAQGENYSYGEAFARAAERVLGRELGQKLREDLVFLQDVGLDKLDKSVERLKKRYDRFDHDGAREILAWLDGKYRFTGEMS
jgi:hypothetical protein